MKRFSLFFTPYEKECYKISKKSLEIKVICHKMYQYFNAILSVLFYVYWQFVQIHPFDNLISKKEYIALLNKLDELVLLSLSETLTPNHIFTFRRKE